MSVPEAPVNENDRAMAREDQVRATRQVGAVKPVSKAAGVQRPAEGHLGTGVAAANSGHHPRPGLAIDDVGHGCFMPDPGATSLRHLFRSARTGPIFGS